MNYVMILYKMKSDLQITPDLILSLNLIKWLLIWLAVKVIVKKQLSKNTATAIHHTCNGIVCLCQHFLATSHKYVLLGQFSTDPFEKEFGKLCQGSGGTYFVNVQQCIEKLHIKQTSLLLNHNVNIDEFDVNPGHQCTSCDYKLCGEGSEIFDNLENLEPSLSNEIKMALVYIVG